MSYRNILLLSLVILGCDSHTWYEKEFTAEEKKVLSEQLLNGSGYYYQGSVPEQFILEEARKMDPLNAGVWREMGVAYLKRGFGEKMYPFYDKAVELDAEKWAGMRGYILLYFYRDYGRALADFNSTDTLTKDFVDHPQGQSVDYMRGICYYGLTDYNKALAYFNKYIESVMNEEGEAWVDPYAVLYRALTYEKLKDEEKALEDFDRVIRIYPNLCDPFYHKAKIYARNGALKRAEVQLAKAEEFFNQGYFHQRPYVEVLEQLYKHDLEELKGFISSDSKQKIDL